MKALLFILLLPLLAGEASSADWQTGDLIFQESASGSLGKAIAGVTVSVNDYHFTHVGMVYVKENGEVFVLEATHPVVALTPLADFLCPPSSEYCPQSVVARLKPEHRHCIPKAIQEGLKLLGKTYDDAFDMNNEQYYCSELIYNILLKANEGKPVFELNEMTFKAGDTGEFLPEWVEHFRKLGIPIPEGEPGINPGAMSRSEVIDIIRRQ